MRHILNKVAQGFREVYQRAGDLIEEERELPLSQHYINSIMQRYVTDKVSAIDDLHAHIFDGWFQLFATVQYKGIRAKLTANFLLIQLQFDTDTQRLVFEQQGQTEVIDIKFDQPWKRLAVNLAIWGCYRILHRDPLGIILEKLNVITVKHDLLYLDLTKYLGDNEKVINTLRKVQINHAILRPEQFVLKANISLRGLFGLDRDERPDDDDEDNPLQLRTVFDDRTR
jgi:hypothetical protein